RDRFKACLYGRGQAFYSKPAFRSYAVHVRRCSIGVYGCCRRGGRRLARLCEKRLAVCLRCVEGNQTFSRSERENHRNISNRRPRRGKRPGGDSKRWVWTRKETSPIF